MNVTIELSPNATPSTVEVHLLECMDRFAKTLYEEMKANPLSSIGPEQFMQLVDRYMVMAAKEAGIRLWQKNFKEIQDAFEKAFAIEMAKQKGELDGRESKDARS